MRRVGSNALHVVSISSEETSHRSHPLRKAASCPRGHLPFVQPALGRRAQQSIALPAPVLRGCRPPRPGPAVAPGSARGARASKPPARGSRRPGRISPAATQVRRAAGGRGRGGAAGAGAGPRAARARHRGSARRPAGRASPCSPCSRWGRWSRGPRARSSPRSRPKRPGAAGRAGFGS